MVADIERKNRAMSAKPASHEGMFETAARRKPHCARHRLSRAAATALVGLLLGAAASVSPALDYRALAATAAAKQLPTGEEIKGEGKPIVFAIRRGTGDKIIRGY